MVAAFSSMVYLARFFAVILVLLLIIFVHEMGHYLMGRLCKIKATCFSLGMGKQVWSCTDKNGMRWRLGLFPIGGYVQFLGQDEPFINREESAEQGKEGRFWSSGVLKRIATVAAGPVANFLFSLFLLTALYLTWGQTYIKPIVGEVLPGLPAAHVGLREGDIFCAADGQKIEKFSDLVSYIRMHPTQPIHFVIQRGANSFTTVMTPMLKMSKDLLGHAVPTPTIGVGVALDKQNPKRIAKAAVAYKPYSFSGALEASLKEMRFIIGATYEGIKQVFATRYGRCQLSGPTKTLQAVWTVSAFGGAALLHLMALLSLSIGLINLFPIPPLDGGYLLLFFLEFVNGKPLPVWCQTFLFKAGLILFLAFSLFCVLNDFIPC